ncbi:hypothetical protein AKJ09_05654 [Labilithrix luteola]|uniref:Uncharacterized protein n=1 Tax=Labilithrix luteola TaxID=1391654 RepID=A0A0K1PZM7_9BACT|nr:hypothetical protein AKJ09_05654 [Labilithrix luteola]
MQIALREVRRSPRCLVQLFDETDLLRCIAGVAVAIGSSSSRNESFRFSAREE